jgi:hypothetical protein
MTRRLTELTTEFHALHESFGKLQRLSEFADSDTWETISDAAQKRMHHISEELVSIRATSLEELAKKAAVALDWLDPAPNSVDQQLATSICRDILLAFADSKGKDEQNRQK